MTSIEQKPKKYSNRQDHGTRGTDRNKIKASDKFGKIITIWEKMDDQIYDESTRRSKLNSEQFTTEDAIQDGKINGPTQAELAYRATQLLNDSESRNNLNKWSDEKEEDLAYAVNDAYNKLTTDTNEKNTRETNSTQRRRGRNAVRIAQRLVGVEQANT